MLALAPARRSAAAGPSDEGVVNPAIRGDRIVKRPRRSYPAGQSSEPDGATKVRKLQPTGNGFTRGLIAGLALGLLCTAAAGSWAAMGKVHWEERNWHFQVGYLAGFLDVIRTLQAREPNSELAKGIPVVPGVPPHVWREHVNTLYAQEANAGRPLMQIIAATGEKLAAQHGYSLKAGGNGGLNALHQYLMERKRREAEAQRAAKSGGDGGGAEDETAGAVQ